MRPATLAWLRQEGLVEMSCTGEWVPSRKGTELLDGLAALEELQAAREKHDPRGMMAGSARAGRPDEGTP